MLYPVVLPPGENLALLGMRTEPGKILTRCNWVILENIASMLPLAEPGQKSFQPWTVGQVHDG